MKSARKPRVTTVKLKALRTCHEGAETQFRVLQCETTVLRYAEAMRRGEKFPPIDVMVTGAGGYYVVDGWHRSAAVERVGRRTIAARVHKAPAGVSPLEAARRMALEANTKHGLPLTPGDQLKRARAVLLLPENRQVSLRKLEVKYGIGKSTLGRVRRELIVEGKLAEWHTGETLPSFVPTEYAHFHISGSQGHPLCWDAELREEVFQFIGRLGAYEPREWRFVVRETDSDAIDDANDHWHGEVEHHGLVPDCIVLFSPFPPNRVVKGMPKVRRIVDPMTDPATTDQRLAWEAAMRRREVEAAWLRLRGHPNRSVAAAVETLQEAAKHEDFRRDLRTVLWEIARPQLEETPQVDDLDETSGALL